MLSLLALGSSVAWGTSDFFAGLASRRRPAVAVVGWTQGLALLVLTVVVAVRWSSITWSGWPVWAVAAGLAGTSGLVCFYTALSAGTMGVVAPIAALGAVVPVALGVATGDQPSPWAWAGMAVATCGVALASGPELSGAVSPRPVVLAACAALGFGLALFFLDRGARESTLMTLWGMRVTSVTVLLVVALLARSVGGVTVRETPALLLIGSGDLTANAMFAVASSSGQVSLAAVLGSLYPVVTALLARILVGERLRGIQRVGIVLAVGGAALIALDRPPGARRVEGCRCPPGAVGGCRTVTPHDTAAAGAGAPPASPSESVLVRATRGEDGPVHPRLVHAPGRPLAAGVPQGARRASGCSSPAAAPTSSPRSPSSRCAGTASTPRSSSPTSSCRSPRSGSTWTSSRGSARSSPSPSAPAPTSTGCPELTPDLVPDIAESVRLLTAELGPTPLIGFAGAPFTLASYLVEGGPSRNHEHTKALMHGDPGLWNDLCARLAQVSGAFLRVQAEAGASAVQLFDSWAGALSRRDYATFVQGHSATALAAVADLGVPRIHFGVGTGELLALMGEAGAEVVGVDYRVSLTDALERLGGRYAVQGNLDPALLFAPWEALERRVREIVDEGRAAPGHVFNLGHGVLPATDPDVLTRVVELVHEASVR